MRPRGPISALALLAGVAAPAQAQAPRPTLTLDRPCYGEQEIMEFSGEQYTPGGEVGFILANEGRLGNFVVTADPSGRIAGRVQAPDPDRFIGEDALRDDIFVSANDQTRMQDPAFENDPEATFAPATFTLTRTRVNLSPAVPKPGKRLRVRVFGIAEAAGDPLYLHYRKGSRSLKVTRLGRSKGDCGDLDVRVRRAFPFKAAPGRYHLFISTSKADPRRGLYFDPFVVRVR